MDEKTNDRLSQLITLITEGNTAALDEIYAIMGKVMFSVAYTILWNRQDAEDVVSETLVTIVRKAHRFTYKKNAYAWINAIVKNKAKSLSKKKNLRNEVGIEGANNQACQEFDYSSMIVKEIFSLLDKYEKDLLIYKHWYGLSYSEIAQTVNKPKQTIVSQVNKIYEKIKKFYKT